MRCLKRLGRCRWRENMGGLKIYSLGGGYSYVRLCELDLDEARRLKDWMVGQTRPLVKDLDPQDAIFTHDYERFKTMRRGKKVIWD